jgi:hypothetical protein
MMHGALAGGYGSGYLIRILQAICVRGLGRWRRVGNHKLSVGSEHNPCFEPLTLMIERLLHPLHVSARRIGQSKVLDLQGNQVVQCVEASTGVQFGSIVLKKSFWADGRKFLGPLTRFVRGDARDHIVSYKIDHGPR